jgi:hypothetical protein
MDLLRKIPINLCSMCSSPHCKAWDVTRALSSLDMMIEHSKDKGESLSFISKKFKIWEEKIQK